MATNDDHYQPGTSARDAAEGTTRLDHAPEGTTMPHLGPVSASDQARADLKTMLSLVADNLKQEGRPLVMAPKSLHQVVQDIAKKAWFYIDRGHKVAYVEPPYDLVAAALIFIMSELANIFGPSVTITPFQHPSNNDHVLFQFKT